MSEYRLYPDHDIPPVSTPQFHADRPRAKHLEDSAHRPRLEKAAEMVRYAAEAVRERGFILVMVSDLGCGDGGLLQLLKDDLGIHAWGYDFHPGAQEGWAERDVRAQSLDVFGVDFDSVTFGDIAVCTEVLEHLAYPHEVLKWIREHTTYLVASSPWTETDMSHDECHAWAWNIGGYRKMFKDAGWTIVQHETVGNFQVVLAKS